LNKLSKNLHTYLLSTMEDPSDALGKKEAEHDSQHTLARNERSQTVEQEYIVLKQENEKNVNTINTLKQKIDGLVELESRNLQLQNQVKESKDLNDQ